VVIVNLFQIQLQEVSLFLRKHTQLQLVLVELMQAVLCLKTQAQVQIQLFQLLLQQVEDQVGQVEAAEVQTVDQVEVVHTVEAVAQETLPQ